jgi:hypothetical protein
MAVIARVLACVAAADVAVNARPTESQTLASRAVISHDAVVGFDETVPSGTIGDAYEAYQPFLKVVNGCVPFPAVDADGNTRFVDLVISRTHTNGV